MKCRICSRNARIDLCEYHSAAKQGIDAGYERWKRAYGDLSLESYLSLLASNPATGDWAQDVLRLMKGEAVRKG